MENNGKRGGGCEKYLGEIMKIFEGNMNDFWRENNDGNFDGKNDVRKVWEMSWKGGSRFTDKI